MTAQQSNTEGFADKAKRKMRNFFLWFVVIAVLVLLALGAFVTYVPYSTGVRAGTVLKVSKRGVIFKTFEGQLDLATIGAKQNKENLFDQAFMFSVRDPEVVRELETVSLSGERVNLRYEEKYVPLPFFGETKYFVVGVERTGRN